MLGYVRLSFDEAAVSTDGEPLPVAKPFAYLCEAKGVQRYILDSGPLRDLIGASELVDDLARVSQVNGVDLVSRILDALGIRTFEFSRRTGGAYCVHVADKSDQIKTRALWRLAAMLSCPGLELTDGLGAADGKDDIAARNCAYENLSALREGGVASLLPSGHPFCAFVPRTGRPAVNVLDVGEDLFLIDGVTTRHRFRADALRGLIDGVASRFLGSQPLTSDLVFPRNLDPEEGDGPDNPAFPFVSDRTRIAVVHADLSGLGQVYRGVVESLQRVEEAFDLSTRIGTAIESAAQAAVGQVIIPAAVTRADNKCRVIPARPVVLGGDDLTIIVRDDLALAFTWCLLREIECRTEKLFCTLKERGLRGQMPLRLSACAGVAIIKRGQPFLMGYALAESLCSFAKKAAKARLQAPYPSALAFHVADSSLQEEYGAAIHESEMKSPLGYLTANPYAVGMAGGQFATSLDDLVALAREIAQVPGGRGKLRELRGHAFGAKEAFEAGWQRWRDVVAERDWELLQAVDRALEKVGARTDPTMDRHASVRDRRLVLFDDEGRSPLFDALELIEMEALDAFSSREAVL